jgi:hypothetical protein
MDDEMGKDGGDEKIIIIKAAERIRKKDTISGFSGTRNGSSWTPNRPRNVLSAAEQDSHNQRMGKPDLDTVHDPVARTLEDGYVVMESRVVEDSLEGGHSPTSSRQVETSRSRFFQSSETGYSVYAEPRSSVRCVLSFEIGLGLGIRTKRRVMVVITCSLIRSISRGLFSRLDIEAKGVWYQY